MRVSLGVHRMTTVIDDDLDLTQYGSGAVSWPLSSSPSRETDSPPRAFPECHAW